MFAKTLKGHQWIVPAPAVCVFEVDELAGVAHGRITVTERSKTSAGRVGEIVVMYDDHYVRIAGHWHIAERVGDRLDAA